MIERFLGRLMNRWLVLAVFAAGHIWLAWYGLKNPAFPMGDINFAYLPWVGQMLQSHSLLGINQPWVYPFPDLIFMFLPHWLAIADYQTSWLLMAAAIDVAVAACLLFWRTDYDAAKVQAVWFWFFAQLLLGPVSISRLDTISVALAIVGVILWVKKRETAASVWFAIVTWIKVWPVMLLAAALTQARRPKAAAIWGIGTGLIIAIAGIVMGGFQNLFSFVTQQTGRGIQIESPWATPWLWGSIAKNQGLGIYYSQQLQTFQVKGPLTQVIADLLGPVFYLALGITLVLGWLALRGVTHETTPLRNEVFTWTVLTGVLDMIVFNKVGSPQYYGWLIVPAVLGIVVRIQNWRVVLIWLGGIMALTGLVYPLLYGQLLSGDQFATAVLGARNLGAIALLVFTNTRLTELVLQQLRKQRTN